MTTLFFALILFSQTSTHASCPMLFTETDIVSPGFNARPRSAAISEDQPSKGAGPGIRWGRGAVRARYTVTGSTLERSTFFAGSWHVSTTMDLSVPEAVRSSDLYAMGSSLYVVLQTKTGLYRARVSHEGTFTGGATKAELIHLLPRAAGELHLVQYRPNERPDATGRWYGLYLAPAPDGVTWLHSLDLTRNEKLHATAIKLPLSFARSRRMSLTPPSKGNPRTSLWLDLLDAPPQRFRVKIGSSGDPVLESEPTSDSMRKADSGARTRPTSGQLLLPLAP